MAQGIIPKIMRLIIRLLYFLITYHAKKKWNHCAEHMKLTQYCKSTLLQFFKKCDIQAFAGITSRESLDN